MPNETTKLKEGTKAKIADEPSAWADIVKRAKDVPQILPRLKLDKGESADVEFLQDRPVFVTIHDDEEDVDRTFPTIDVRNLKTGEKQTLALSAVSIQNGVGALYAERGTLKGVFARIRCETYDHPKWGPNTIGYRVSAIEKPTPA